MIRSIGLKSVGALLALLLVSCSQEGVLSEQEYHETASKAMEDKYYDVAIHHYQKLLEEYPFSDYSEESQLKIGQAQYLNKQYAESIASFQDFQRMEARYPGIKERLCEADGRVRRFVNIYVNGDDIRFLANLETAVANNDEVSIVPAIAGGR